MASDKKKTLYRVIFEFASTDQVEALLTKLAGDLESGTLRITGEWEWGAEEVIPVDLETNNE